STFAGVTGVSAVIFIAASAIGYIPQMLIFALVGSGVHLDTGYGIGLSVVLFVISGLMGVHLYRKHRHGKRLGDDIDRKLGNGSANGN
ncbi:MAG: SNARE associated Golgi protein, partial [Rhodospirillaceae bacterium]|nr:SNARE associated Golgi protein [Rhodospirillaceae bacterium]